MSGAAVIYKSKYGYTERYARWIAQELGAQLFEASQIKPAQLASYDVVVYGGGLYAGSINGVSLVTKNPCKSLVVFTVGLADPAITDFSETLKRTFPGEALSKVKVFHLRGGIDFQKLGLAHKGMMAIFRKATAKKDKTKLSGEEKAMLETDGKNVDFTDRDAIAPLVAYVKENM